MNNKEAKRKLSLRLSKILYNDLLSRWYLDSDEKVSASIVVANKIADMVYRKREIEIPAERLDILKWI